MMLAQTQANSSFAGAKLRSAAAKPCRWASLLISHSASLVEAADVRCQLHLGASPWTCLYSSLEQLWCAQVRQA